MGQASPCPIITTSQPKRPVSECPRSSLTGRKWVPLRPACRPVIALARPSGCPARPLSLCPPGLGDRRADDRTANCVGHIDRMHEAPSDHRRWCHQNDDARPLAAGWIAVTILAASVTAPGAVVASQELQRCASPVRVAISPPVGGFNVKR